MRRSDVTELSIKPHRHVGGILVVKTSELKCENPENLSSLIMRRPVYFIGTQQLASMLKFTTLHCCNVVGLYLQHDGGAMEYRKTSLLYGVSVFSKQQPISSTTLEML